MQKNMRALIIIWPLAVSISLLWGISHQRLDKEQEGVQAARSFFQQIVLDRAWNAGHGGIYVVVTEATQPNPHLKHPLRDHTTTDGIRLTMINPAFMTRQISEIAAGQEGVQFHITSLNPLRPENSPTEWERRWLASFAQGATEQTERVGDTLRYMAPLFVTKSCLPCHAEQGYQEGDIRGGISVSLPLLTNHHNFIYLGVSHVSALILGLGIIMFIGAQISRGQEELHHSEQIQMVINRLLHQSMEHDSLNHSLADFIKNLTSLPLLGLEPKGAILLIDEQRPDTLVLRAQQGLDPAIVDICREVPLGSCLCGRAAATGELVFSDHLDSRHENHFAGIQNHGHYCVPIKNQDQRVVGIFTLYVKKGSRRDHGVEESLLAMANVLAVTIERRQMEEALKENKRLMASVLDSIQDGISVLDPDLTILHVNHTMKSWYGHALPLEGKKCYAAYHGRTQPCTVCPSRRALQSGRIETEEIALRNEEGEVCGSLELFAYPMKDEGGEVHGVVEYFRDITARKKAEEEKAAMQGFLIQQEKMASVGLLAAGVAHEINNPIGFIKSNLSTLSKYTDKLLEFSNAQAETLASLQADGELKTLRRKLKIDFIMDDTGDLLAESVDGINRIKDIVQNLKSFSRVDEAHVKMADINNCLESTLKIIWNELKYKVRIQKEYGDLPPTRCYPQQLNQVFMNLILNGAHAIGKQGEIGIRTWQEEDSILIAISDTGSGIAPDKITKIFEPFFTTKEAGKGTGLGLSISYDIIKRHGGEITVESDEGRGTTFTVRLPIVDEA